MNPHQDAGRPPVLHRPPEPVWAALVTALAVLELILSDGLGLAVGLSFLAASVLARPTWRLPLRTLFVLTVACKAVRCVQDDHLVLLALYVAIAVHGLTGLRQDIRSVFPRQETPSDR
ncbi:MULTISPECIES: hypothetical protein [unclassified Streptomyces]|uniref:hypothetical protein n=1 Tax=unclassified Streptomyces TaxID=2593676 RepID=UPI0033B90FBF